MLGRVKNTALGTSIPKCVSERTECGYQYFKRFSVLVKYIHIPPHTQSKQDNYYAPKLSIHLSIAFAFIHSPPPHDRVGLLPTICYDIFLIQDHLKLILQLKIRKRHPEEVIENNFYLQVLFYFNFSGWGLGEFVHFINGKCNKVENLCFYAT